MNNKLFKLESTVSDLTIDIHIACRKLYDATLLSLFAKNFDSKLKERIEEMKEAIHKFEMEMVDYELAKVNAQFPLETQNNTYQ